MQHCVYRRSYFDDRIQPPELRYSNSYKPQFENALLEGCIIKIYSTSTK